MSDLNAALFALNVIAFLWNAWKAQDNYKIAINNYAVARQNSELFRHITEHAKETPPPLGKTEE
jgi:hypothetical protein